MIQSINLFPDSLKPKKIPFSFSMIVRSGVMVTVGMLIISSMQWYELSIQQAKATTLKNDYEALKVKVENFQTQNQKQIPDPNLDTKIIDLQSEKKLKESVLGFLSGNLLGYVGGYSGFFKAFGRNEINEFSLTRVFIENAGTSIKIDGKTTSPIALAKFLENMQQEEIMKGISMGYMEITRDNSNEDLIGFTLGTASESSSTKSVESFDEWVKELK
ncbi:MAG: hypothetical protein V4629_05250 [Pseudomonadota bacterium]